MFVFDEKNCVIETERLILRPWKMSDLDDMVSGLSVFDVAKNLTVPHPYLKDDGINYISRHLKNGNGKFAFAITEKGMGRAIGGTSIDYDAETLENNGGIWLCEEAQGKGYGTEVMTARARFGFEVLGLKTISNGFFSYNEKSKKMQLKIGYKMIGERDGFCPALGNVKEVRTELSKEDFYKANGNND